MEVVSTPIADLVLIKPSVFGDKRGYFVETYQQEKYSQHGIATTFIQDNESRSGYGVIRGLHYQQGAAAQAKLVRAIEGRILDVAVDLRTNSTTFGNYFAVELSGENKHQLFVPRGFAHGFAVLSQEAVIAYKVDNAYNPAAETGIRYDDPNLGIDWGVAAEQVILSDKDKQFPNFENAYYF